MCRMFGKCLEMFFVLWRTSVTWDVFTQLNNLMVNNVGWMKLFGFAI